MKRVVPLIFLATFSISSFSVIAADKVVVVPMMKGPHIGKQSITPGISDQSIKQGYHDGTGVVVGDADLVAENIVKGVTIFGVTGTDPTSNYELIARNTLKDSVTGLTWQLDDDGTERTWAEASDYCDNLFLGYSLNWRLPTKDELKGLVVCTNGTATPLGDSGSGNHPYYCGDGNIGLYDTPTIDIHFLSREDRYWTSNTSGIASAWTVNFSNGLADTDTSTAKNYVRCVRIN